MKVLYLIPYSEKENSFIFAKRESKLLNLIPGCHVEIFYLRYDFNPISLLINLFKLRKKIMNEGFDIIHVQYGTITALLGALVTFRKKYIITFRGADINGSPDVHPIREKLSLYFSWIAMSFSDAVIFVSTALKEKSPMLYSASHVIPTGVNVKDFFPKEQNVCRQKLTLDLNKKYVLFYSSFNSTNKRQDIAVAAMEHLSKIMDGVELLIIDGGLSTDIMPDYLNAIDALLLVSDYEGSPTMVQEAIACGTSVVTVDVGDVKEVLSGIRNCFVTERNPVEIALALKKALLIGKEKPSHSFLQKYDLHSCVSQIKNSYEKLT